MLNPLARSQERQITNNNILLKSHERSNTLQENILRNFFKRRQTNRSPIIARPILKSPNSSSTSSLKGFIFSFIKNDINDVHSYILNYQDILIYYKDNIENILTNKKIKDIINIINENIKKNNGLIIEDNNQVNINKLYSDYNCNKKDELISNMFKEINHYKNYCNELNHLFFILNLKFNNSNNKFCEQYIESNSLFSNIKFFLDEMKNKNESLISSNNFMINKSINLNLNKSVSSFDNIEDDNEIIDKIKEMNNFYEFLDEKFTDNEKLNECFEKIKALYYKSNEDFFSCFIDLIKNTINDNSFRLKNIETSIINKTGNSQENVFLLRQIIEENYNKIKLENENLNKKIFDLNNYIENQKNENEKIKQQIEIINNIDLKEYLNELKEENINFIQKIKKVEQKKIEIIKKQLQKKQEEYDELNTINKGYKEEINLLKKELEFKCFNLNEDEFIKILKLQRDKMKEELINQIKNDNRAYNQNIREYQEKIINLQEETKKSRELEQILISRLNQLNNLFSRNL